ncbi:hypothetical protein CEUSTIGMA_g4806.t1 [Chlamydomonas eustigma]|uniref:NAD(P)H dehydrogenase (quinone) n=1 Tax=Chlamydomonas eustigma TaxID=1157962 RepID=A0A250X3L4_9CHLO|nr:hypothetical protein CEUSTIGMA_g4806.t1 [Chlamydomonas eustigma]|eukprot:GAX77360.1 hypothetical protein CEUSTIGMA_g4806.t1 [Chlamydomonas eustigma]
MLVPIPHLSKRALLKRSTVAATGRSQLLSHNTVAWSMNTTIPTPPNPAIEGQTHWPYRLVGDALQTCWVQKLDLSAAKSFNPNGNTSPPRILVLYGSLRERSYSKLLAYEYARIFELLGCEVRVFNPSGLPMQGDGTDQHPKVQELRNLTLWSEGHVWVSPEQHGAVTAVFKNQIDWIPLSLGSVRPTQGRTLCVSQVNGGSQSFNVVNTLRLLGRWMRMFTIPNQSSIPKAWTEFDEPGRLKPGSFRDRVVDVAEEMYRMTMLMRDHIPDLIDRYSERKEIEEKGRLLSQAEKEQAANTSKKE